MSLDLVCTNVQFKLFPTQNTLTHIILQDFVTDDPVSKPDQKYVRRRDRQNYMGRIK